MNSPAQDICDYLVAQGAGTLGASSGWSINAFKEPASPDSTVTVYDTGGLPPDYDNNIYRPSVQVRVRDNAYRDGYSKAEEVRDILIAPKGFTQATTRYVGVWQEGGFEGLGYDENDRAIIVMNFNIIREEAT